ncbi:hypothetical protein [Kitasatospora sp. NPDC047058]|uniref:hypothetical protein n=1 Tax=Kitasatospora sp. NPDC047058 TaxID=3155620 RepID=UPI0033E155B3
MITEYPETLPGPARTALSVTAEGTHFDTVLEGRHTYEIGVKAGIDDAYPHLKHVVFSRSLTSVPGAAVELVGTGGHPAARCAVVSDRRPPRDSEGPVSV